MRSATIGQAWFMPATRFSYRSIVFIDIWLPKSYNLVQKCSDYYSKKKTLFLDFSNEIVAVQS